MTSRSTARRRRNLILRFKPRSGSPSIAGGETPGVLTNDVSNSEGVVQWTRGLGQPILGCGDRVAVRGSWRPPAIDGKPLRGSEKSYHTNSLERVGKPASVQDGDSTTERTSSLADSPLSNTNWYKIELSRKEPANCRLTCCTSFALPLMQQNSQKNRFNCRVNN